MTLWYSCCCSFPLIDAEYSFEVICLAVLIDFKLCTYRRNYWTFCTWVNENLPFTPPKEDMCNLKFSIQMLQLILAILKGENMPDLILSKEENMSYLKFVQEAAKHKLAHFLIIGESKYILSCGFSPHQQMRACIVIESRSCHGREYAWK